MRSYSIQATSRYAYTEPAIHGHHLVRMLPTHRVDQRVLQASLEVSPHTLTRNAKLDFFGNAVDTLTVGQTHQRFTVTMQAQVQISRQPSLLSPSLRCDDVASQALVQKSLAPESPAHFLAASPYTKANRAIRDLAEDCFTASRPIGMAALLMAEWITTHLSYDGEATTVETTARQALEMEAGVCQDFAHVMIAACRSMGVPARYVSGYIRTTPPPGEQRLQGADAMHAWVSVWTGQSTGWVDYDPTNACQIAEDHISVAVGRDYGDVPPVCGNVVGGGEQSDTVAVDVIELTS